MHTPYSIDAHATFAKEAGMPADMIDAAVCGRPAAFANEREQVIYELATALANSRWIPQVSMIARSMRLVIKGSPMSSCSWATTQRIPDPRFLRCADWRTWDETLRRQKTAIKIINAQVHRWFGMLLAPPPPKPRASEKAGGAGSHESAWRSASRNSDALFPGNVYLTEARQLVTGHCRMS